MGESFLADIPGTHIASFSLDPVAAGDATEQQSIFTAPFKCVVESVKFVPDAAVTGDNTNRKNLNIVNKGTGGSGTTELANLDLVTGTNLVSKDEKEIGTIATNDLSKGSVIALEIEQVGTGVAIPAGLVQIEYHPSPSGI